MPERRKVATASCGADLRVTVGNETFWITHSLGGFSRARSGEVYDEGDTYRIVERTARFLRRDARREIIVPKWQTTIEKIPGSVIAALLGLR